jgi:hypothetical protein
MFFRIALRYEIRYAYLPQAYPPEIVKYINFVVNETEEDFLR